MENGWIGGTLIGAVGMILMGVVGLIAGFILRKRWLAALGFLVLMAGIGLLLMLDLSVDTPRIGMDFEGISLKFNEVFAAFDFSFESVLRDLLNG